MIIVADIGGTYTRVAASENNDATLPKLQNHLVFGTPHAYESGVSALKENVQTASGGKPIEAFCLGMAGMFAEDRAHLFRSPNLTAWEGHDLKHDLEKALHAPAYLQNDAALEGLGEALYGAGRGAPIVAYLTVGTGVGGARIVDGTIDRATYGFEIGQQYLHSLRVPETLEELIGGAALEKKYGMPPAEINNPKVWQECAEALAYGLYNTLLHWSPSVVVLGGSLFRGKNSIRLSAVTEKLRAINRMLPKLPDLLPAELADRAGLLGAVSYVRSNQKQALD